VIDVERQMVYTKTMANLVVKDIDEQLKRQFKSLCALEGKSVAEKIRELIRREVEQHDKK
jgi:plasmid stability protein